jgi:hypothetical protein
VGGVRGGFLKEYERIGNEINEKKKKKKKDWRQIFGMERNSGNQEMDGKGGNGFLNDLRLACRETSFCLQ